MLVVIFIFNFRMEFNDKVRRVQSEVKLYMGVLAVMKVHQDMENLYFQYKIPIRQRSVLINLHFL